MTKPHMKRRMIASVVSAGGFALAASLGQALTAPIASADELHDLTVLANTGKQQTTQAEDHARKMESMKPVAPVPSGVAGRPAVSPGVGGSVNPVNVPPKPGSLVDDVMKPVAPVPSGVAGRPAVSPGPGEESQLSGRGVPQADPAPDHRGWSRAHSPSDDDGSAARQATGDAPPKLASTGSTVLAPAGFGVAFIVLGSGLVVFVRRRRNVGQHHRAN